VSTPHIPLSPLVEVALLFLRFGLTAFGGPAAHIALIERECVARRRWMTREEFMDILGVSSLIPGPTSTELAMHIGRKRAGWAGLVAAGLAFIVPAAVLVGTLAAVYVRAGALPVTRGIVAAVAPVVVILIAQSILPLGRTVLRSPLLIALATVAAIAAAAGAPELYVLLAAGAVHLVSRWTNRIGPLAALVALSVPASIVAQQATVPDVEHVFAYFVRVGSLLFGSGYVLLPVLEGDLVQRLGWLTPGQLLDAIAAGQVTPGPVFTTATFIGYVIGGPWMAAAATVGMFLPAFVFVAMSSVVLARLAKSPGARAFLDGVNAAAVALIAVVALTLARTAFAGGASIGVGLVAAVLLFAVRVHPTILLLMAALGGGIWTQTR
jgi:chromate transporter